MNFIFKKIELSHTQLPQVIAPSIGNATQEKIQLVLDSYQKRNHHIIGCFFNQQLIAVIGVEQLNNKANVRHISVLEKFKSQGIGKGLIEFVIKHFSLISLSAETDKDAIGFYQALGFFCEAFKGEYGIRYKCTLDLSENRSKPKFYLINKE